MFRRIGLIPVIAAASILLSGCEWKQSDGGVDDNVYSAAPAADTPAAGQGSPTGGACGGLQGATCASDKDFCKLPAGQCDVADAAGVCTTRPEVCTEQYDPVCGCDDKTYGNACAADAAGVGVKAEGECPKPKA